MAGREGQRERKKGTERRTRTEREDGEREDLYSHRVRGIQPPGRATLGPQGPGRPWSVMFPCPIPSLPGCEDTGWRWWPCGNWLRLTGRASNTGTAPFPGQLVPGGRGDQTSQGGSGQHCSQSPSLMEPQVPHRRGYHDAGVLGGGWGGRGDGAGPRAGLGDSVAQR